MGITTTKCGFDDEDSTTLFKKPSWKMRQKHGVETSFRKPSWKPKLPRRSLKTVVEEPLASTTVFSDCRGSAFLPRRFLKKRLWNPRLFFQKPSWKIHDTFTNNRLLPLIFPHQYNSCSELKSFQIAPKTVSTPLCDATIFYRSYQFLL